MEVRCSIVTLKESNYSFNLTGDKVRGSPSNMTNIAVLYLDDPLYQPDDDNFMETLIASHMTKLPTGAWVCNFCNKESKFKRNIGRLHLNEGSLILNL